MATSGENQKTLIYKHLIRVVASGRPGDKIPSETELLKLFSVSRGTVRAAIQDLVAEGFLVPKQGAGVFIKAQRQVDPREMLISIVIGSGRIAYYDYYFGELLSGAVGEVCRRGHSFAIIDNMSGEESFVDEIAQNQPNGVIWLNPTPKQILDLTAKKIPATAWGAIGGPENVNMEVPMDCSGAFFDSFEEGFRFVEHCLDKGFERLLIIDQRYSNVNKPGPFARGVERAMKKRNLDTKEQVRRITPRDMSEKKLRKALSDGFQAIYVNNEWLPKVHRALRGEGFKHGEDCLLVSRKAQISALHPEIECDLVDLRLSEIAVKGVELLFDRIAHPESEPEQILVAPEILENETEL